MYHNSHNQRCVLLEEILLNTIFAYVPRPDDFLIVLTSPNGHTNINSTAAQKKKTSVKNVKIFLIALGCAPLKDTGQ